MRRLESLLRPALILFLLLAAAACSDEPVADNRGAGRCGTLIAGDGELVIDTATWTEPAPTWQPATESFYQPLPVTVPLCRVEATIEGNIGLELWLPDADLWNRRLLAAGVGGPAGVFNYSDMSRRTNEGFASFSTDSGHKQSDLRWMADPKAVEDYTHRASHLATVWSKRLVEQYYGRPAEHSYFLGCSGGGRQGLKEMQNFPDDFDGIVAGAPGPNMPLQSVRMLWFALEQERNPAAVLDDMAWDLYEAAVTKACDANDGITDGVVENPLACRFRISSVQCGNDQVDACLTSEQAGMLEQIVAPMLDEKGDPMDDGLVPGVRTRPGPPSPLLRALWADGVYDNPEWDEQSFARTRDLERLHEVMPEMRADRTSIGPFLDDGRKAIIYQGWADPSTVAGPTLRYYRELAAAHGGIDALADSIRLFMVPGMYHCRGGPGADQFGGSGQQNWPGDPERDILWSVIRWVEEGIAPDRLTATKIQDETEAFTHTLCPFPASAVVTQSATADTRPPTRCSPDPILSGDDRADDWENPASL